jgi:glycosyltransferase involved in cell wall biosynthesis
MTNNINSYGPKPDWSIILPIYNEAGNIPEVFSNLIETLKKTGKNFEIIAVDDGSTDDSLKVLKAFQADFPDCLIIIRHVVNKGNGAAIRTGIRFARADILITLDADGQHDPKYIPELVNPIPPYDLVVAARTKTYKGKWYRNLANRFYIRFASWLTQTKIEDLTSGFRAYRRQAISHYLHLLPSGYSSPTTSTIVLLKGGYNVKYVPVEVSARKKGSSKINIFKDGWRFIVIILRMVILYDPLRIFLPVSFINLSLGLITMVVGIIAANRLVIPGSSVVLYIASVLTILLGLVSSQITNIAIQYHGDEHVEVIGSNLNRNKLP